MRLFGSLLMVWLCALPLAAQLNTKVGYTLGFYDNPAYAALVERYNAARPWLEPLPDRDAVSGLTIGLRYRREPFGVEVSWRNQFTNNRRQGTDPTTDTGFERRIATRLNTYSAGLEVYGGVFTVGGSLDYNTFGVRTEVTGVDGTFDVVEGEGSFGHTLYVSVEPEVGDGRLRVALRPYWQAVWNDFDFGALGRELEPDRAATAPGTDYREAFNNFGLMIIFYNGQE